MKYLIALLVFSTTAFCGGKTVVKIRTYYKPGYQSLSLEEAKAVHRNALRRVQYSFQHMIRISHRFEEIPHTVAPYENAFEDCYRIPDFENGACCPMEYIQRHLTETKAWKRTKEVAMFINPPTGGNDYYQGAWLSGGITQRSCFGGNPNTSVGIINATAINLEGKPRRKVAEANYEHELLHAAFNARHRPYTEKQYINIMGNYSVDYDYIELMLSLYPFSETGLPLSPKTIKEAIDCIFLYREEQKKRR